VDAYLAASGERAESFDNADELHPVVRRAAFAAAELALVLAVDSNAAQPPGPGLPEQAPSVHIATTTRELFQPLRIGGSAISWAS